MLGSGATSNYIAGNFIGTDMTGKIPIPNSQSGIIVAAGANDNPIVLNVISANVLDGVDIGGVGTSNNTLRGNYIGTDLGGTLGGKLANGRNGVDIYGGATNNTIGGYTIQDDGATSTGGNLISNNHGCGVCIFDTDANVTEGNKVEGNYIGTDINGLAPLPNLLDGVTVTDGAAYNYIGGIAGDLQLRKPHFGQQAGRGLDRRLR